MKIPAIVSSLVLLSFTALASAAETHKFDLLTRGKKTANVTYTVDNGKNGTKVRTSIDYVVNTTPTRTIEYKVTPDGLMGDASISIASTRTITFYNPSKAHDSIKLSLTVDNQSKGIVSVPMAKPDFLFAYPEDATVWQILLDLHKLHPHSDSIYTLLALTRNDTSSALQPMRVEKPTESKGTLDGKDIVLQHYVVTFNASKAQLYATEEGKLMQADIPLFGVSHVRANFSLAK